MSSVEPAANAAHAAWPSTWRALLQVSPTPTWVTDATGSTIVVNDALAAILERGAERRADLPFLDGVHAEDRANVRSAWHDAVASGHPFDVTFRLRRADGATRRVRARAHATPADTDGPLWIGTLTDAPAVPDGPPDPAGATVEPFDAFLDSAPVGLGLVDRELRYVRVNTAFAHVCGVPAASLPGRSVGGRHPGPRA